MGWGGVGWGGVGCGVVWRGGVEGWCGGWVRPGRSGKKRGGKPCPPRSRGPAHRVRSALPTAFARPCPPRSRGPAHRVRSDPRSNAPRSSSDVVRRPRSRCSSALKQLCATGRAGPTHTRPLRRRPQALVHVALLIPSERTTKMSVLAKSSCSKKMLVAGSASDRTSPNAGCASFRSSGVQGSRLEVRGSGFAVRGSGFGVQGSGFRVQGSGFTVRVRG